MSIEYKKGLYGVQLEYDKEAFVETCMLINSHLNEMFSSNQLANPKKGPTEVISTLYFAEYNILTFTDPNWHNLYKKIQTHFHLCYELYHQRKVDKPHYIRSWLNVYEKGQYIDWHGHWDSEFNAWHGFFCVDVEPNSKTSYMWKDDIQMIDVDSKNGLLVLGLSDNDQHKSSEWNQETPRITIAFDILPFDSIMSTGFIKLNHWIPI